MELPESAPAWACWVSKNDGLVVGFPLLIWGVRAYLSTPSSIPPPSLVFHDAPWALGACAIMAVCIRVLQARYTRRHRLWARTGACMRCGYDRAGLLATAPCPECGVLPTIPPSA